MVRKTPGGGIREVWGIACGPQECEASNPVKSKMVLTKAELISSLQHEVQILVHLCGKVPPEMIDYRPTPKQRSTIELLRYLAALGRGMVPLIQAGEQQVEQWGILEKQVAAMDFDAVVKSLEALSPFYAEAVGAFSDEELRRDLAFGPNAGKVSCGKTLVDYVLCIHAAYRTQLFCYLKACGREELNTQNLWAAVDGKM